MYIDKFIVDFYAKPEDISPPCDLSDYTFEQQSLPCPVKWDEDMRKECGDRQRELLTTGEHYFSKNTERNISKVKDGTHPFLDREAQRERAKRPRKRSPKIYVAEANRERMAKGQHIQISTVTCPHCGKSGNYMIMKRWHFDNCKIYAASSESRSK